MRLKNAKKHALSLVLTSTLATFIAFPAPYASAAGAEGTIVDKDFSFDGVFGKFDQDQLKRGLEVYRNVCSSCHGMKYVPFRTLTDSDGPGLSEDEMREIASSYEVPDLEGEPGETREGKPTDSFPSVSGIEGNPPDLSLMTKARPHGPDYVYSLLTSYTGETKEEAGTVLYENKAFPGGWIAMSQPLYGDDIEYSDGTEATLEQMSEDVTAFLTWAAEPKMHARKELGLNVIGFLAVFGGLLYLSNRKLWKKVKS